jgi:hypothetical protein
MGTWSDAQRPVRNRFWPLATSRRNDTLVGRALLNRSDAMSIARYTPAARAVTRHPHAPEELLVGVETRANE